MQACVFMKTVHLKVVNNNKNWNLKTTKNVIQCSSEKLTMAPYLGVAQVDFKLTVSFVFDLVVICDVLINVFTVCTVYIN